MINIVVESQIKNTVQEKIEQTKITGASTLDLRKLNLREMPLEILELKKLVALDLSDNPLMTLSTELFELSNLEILVLDENQLKSFFESISDSFKLEHLFLIGKTGSILEVSSEQERLTLLVEQFQKFKETTIAHTKADILSVDTSKMFSIIVPCQQGYSWKELLPFLSQQVQLKTLALDSLGLETLPTEVSCLTQLRTLSIEKNCLTALPEYISQLPNLLQLDISDNQITSLSDNITQLSCLMRLDISNNRLSTLPECIFKLVNIIRLDVSDNQIASLPDNVAQLSCLIRLDISNNQLNTLPECISQLVNLEKLFVSGNRLITLPDYMGQLLKLQVFGASNNELTILPPWIARLTELQELYVSNNKLEVLPDWIGQLTELQELDVSNNKLKILPNLTGFLLKLKELNMSNNELSILPDWIGQFSDLLRLSISGNHLTVLPSCLGNLSNLMMLTATLNQLTVLPDSITELSNLTMFSVTGNELTILPENIGQLSNLGIFFVTDNKLTTLPESIGQLSKLSLLFIANNQLTALPNSIHQLSNLKALYAWGNQLTNLPENLDKLSNLTVLDVDDNQLSFLPECISKLPNLIELSASGNQLAFLPSRLCSLSQLMSLNVSNNPLHTPPVEIIDQGFKGIKAYLQDMETYGAEQAWTCKLLVVGEGRVGKTSLRRRLFDEPFNRDEDSTHGMSVSPWKVIHPENPNIEICLHSWDFGGQEIMHATHQFFLTNKSIFVLVWNAMMGYEQGRLYYWLETITNRAPDSPIIIVATHMGGLRAAELPFKDIQKQYPQVKARFVVECDPNKEIPEHIAVDSISSLREAILQQALKLPVMQMVWPKNWLDCIQSLQDSELCSAYAHGCDDPSTLWRRMTQHNIPESHQDVVADYLHDLGYILFYRRNPNLQDRVMLKPGWVIEQIYKVLEDPAVSQNKGQLIQSIQNRVWPRRELDIGVQEYLLHLMQEFDLAYPIAEHGTANDETALKAMIVECLPPDTPEIPEALQQTYDQLAQQGKLKIEFKFDVIQFPPGIPTWFIARKFSYTRTTGLHWRFGAWFRTDDQRHIGTVEANEIHRSVTLTVVGPEPAWFFGALKDTFEDTLKRYPGLENKEAGIKRIARSIPCPCQDEITDTQPCTYRFNFDILLERRKNFPEKETVECQQTGKDVSIFKLLSGLEPSSIRKALQELASASRETNLHLEEHKSLLNQIWGLQKATHQITLSLMNALQQSVQADFPKLFTLRSNTPLDDTLARLASGATFTLQVYCEAPVYYPDKAPVMGKSFEIKRSPEWVCKVAPFVKHGLTALKLIGPFINPSLGIISDATLKTFEHQVDLTEKLIEKLALPNLQGAIEVKSELAFFTHDDNRHSDIESIRLLKELFEEIKIQNEGKEVDYGLYKLLTTEGYIYWVCKEQYDYYYEHRQFKST